MTTTTSFKTMSASGRARASVQLNAADTISANNRAEDEYGVKTKKRGGTQYFEMSKKKYPRSVQTKKALQKQSNPSERDSALQGYLKYPPPPPPPGRHFASLKLVKVIFNRNNIQQKLLLLQATERLLTGREERKKEKKPARRGD